MKKLASFFLVLLVSVATSFADESKLPTDKSLIAFTQQRATAVRITEKPVKMFDRVAALCAMSVPDRHIFEKTNSLGKHLEDPHWQKYAHVFVSPQGAPAMRTNSAVFPLGTIILKEKFGDAMGRSTELFTGMVKREPGYNSECGDWEFFTLSADAKKITSRGRLQSCMACHVEYKESDFVTKKYATYSY